MKKAAILLASMAIIFPCPSRPVEAAQVTGIKPCPLEITLVPSKQNDDVGLSVYWMVTNTSQVSLRFSTMKPLVSYEIKDSLGNRVFERSREDGAHQTGPGPGFIGSVGSYTIEPGQTIKENEELSSRYPIRPYASYSITATVALGSTWKCPQSNFLTIVSGTSVFAISLVNKSDNDALSPSLMVQASVKNISSSALVIKAYSSLRAYRLFRVVVMADGKEVDKTRLYRMVTGHPLPSEKTIGPGSIDYLTLTPGESIGFQIDLAKLYKINKAKTYSVVAGLAVEATTTSPALSAPIKVRVSTNKLELLRRERAKEMTVAD